MCLLAMCIPLWEEFLVKSLAHFLIRLFCFLLLSCRGSLCISDTGPLSDMWFVKISSILYVVFSLSWYHLTKVFNFHEIQFILSFVLCSFGVIYRNPLSNAKSLIFTLRFSSQSCIVLALMFRSLTHFELIFKCIICLWKSSCSSTWFKGLLFPS